MEVSRALGARPEAVARCGGHMSERIMPCAVALLIRPKPTQPSVRACIRSESEICGVPRPSTDQETRKALDRSRECSKASHASP